MLLYSWLYIRPIINYNNVYLTFHRSPKWSKWVEDVGRRYNLAGASMRPRRKEKIVIVLSYLSTMPWSCMGEWMYRSPYSWPRHYLEASGQLHAPAASHPGKKTTYWIGDLIHPRNDMEDVEGKNSWPIGTRAVQPLARRYTYYAIPAP
jgi:hypothetical protein